jgi:membrane-bound serine protease (ClpP class)
MKFVLVGAILLATCFAMAQEPPVPSVVPLLRVSGPISPASADYIARGLKKAAQQRSPVLVLQIDTPGGLDSSTRQIVKDILASKVPVLAWVAPGGARAASAGAYIVHASHVAAMAPGTNLGAATPVQMGGLPGTPTPDKPAPPITPDGKASAPTEPAQAVRSGADAMTRKIVNDSAAYLRSLAQMRGRNGEWADSAVRDGVSLSAQEAQSRRVIDFIAADLTELLQQAHGRTVQMSNGVRRTVDSRGWRVVAMEPDWRNRLLGLITDPSVAYVLLLLGIYGIYFELTTPGVIVPGVAGSISLLLGLFALQMLPVSYAGAALIVLGFALLVAEAWLPSFGALGIGGTIAFVIGSVMLIDTDLPGFGIPRGLIATVAGVNALFVLVVVRLALKARQRPVLSGSEELPGMSGEILESSAQGAWMRLRGERWRVQSDAPLHRGQRVRVIGRQGLVLQVKPMQAASAGAAAASGSPGVSGP